jgi:chromosome segregation ATPase
MMRNVSLLLLGAAGVNAMEVNPIRKVVTLMQEMKKEVEAEGKTEDELFEKFMCYCKGNNEALAKQAEEAAAAADELSAKAKAETGEKKQVDADLATAKSDRINAKADLAKATKLREKEAATYAETNADALANLDATSSAITALEKGMGVAFLQSSTGLKLKNVISNFAENLDMDDKEMMASFLEGDYAPASGQIVGILKNMKDEMEKSIGEAKDAEDAAVAAFADLKAAKQKEIAATTAAIESLTKRSGELAVSIVQNKNSAKDASEENADATEFLANLKKNCADKQSEHDENVSVRAQEIEAISQAIAILNEDDALDLFKSTLKTPEAPKAAFLQVRETKGSKAAKVMAILASSKSTSTPVALLQNALTGQLRNMEKNKTEKMDFSKVLKMIDDMVTLLNKEQKDDENSKKWCETEFDTSDDSEKTLNQELKALSSSASEMSDEIASLKQAISDLNDKIAALDQSVAEATEQRKNENAEFTSAMQANNMAIELIGKAKNKLMKFYNPDLAVEETEEAAPAEFVQVTMRQPEPAPETASYAPKTQKSNGITALLDKLIRELEVGNQDAEHAEKTAQRDYEELLAEAQKTRKEDTKSTVDKKKAKADLEESLEETQRTQSLKATAMAELKTYIADLHKSCDFILANFETRREARTNEVEGLKKAKAVLSGADYSLF